MISNKLINKCIFISLFICLFYVYKIPEAEAPTKRTALQKLDDFMNIVTRHQMKSLNAEITHFARRQAQRKIDKSQEYLQELTKHAETLPNEQLKSFFMQEFMKTRKELETNAKYLAVLRKKLHKQLWKKGIEHPKVQKLKKQIIDAESNDIMLNQQDIKLSQLLKQLNEF